MRELLTILLTISFLLISCKKENFDQPSIAMYSTANGLPDNWIYCIAEDKSGNIWIGTENGVGKYDGLQCQTYFDTLQFDSKRVKNITIDKSGNIWFEFLNGLCKYNGLVLKYNSFDELYSNLDSNQNYYYSYSNNSNRKIYQNKGNSFIVLDIPLIHYDYCSVNDILLDSKGNFWVSLCDYCEMGITKYDGKSWTNYVTSDIFDDDRVGNSIYGIVESKNGNILFSTGSLIIQYDGQNWSVYLDLPKLSKEFIGTYGLFEDSKENLWYGIDKLYKYNKSKVQEIDLNSFPKNGQYDRIINTYFEDSKGNVWIGTGDGLFMIK